MLKAGKNFIILIIQKTTSKATKLFHETCDQETEHQKHSQKTKKPDSMLPIRICMVLLILVTWNDWTTVLICWCFSESNGCCCGNKTTTKKHLKLTVCPNIRKEILTDQIKQSLPNNIWRGISTQKIHPIEISTENNFKRNIHQQKSSCSLDEKLQT